MWGIILFVLLISIMAISMTGWKGLFVPAAFVIAYWALIRPLIRFKLDTDV